MTKSLIEWLNYLESLQPDKIELGLERITSIAQKIDLYPFPAKIITVAGTNGKGSTTAFLENTFLQLGFKTGAYTSPHLIEFNERIRIQGVPISNQALIWAFEQIEQILSVSSIHLTYFEWTTLAAFLCFREAQLDWVILEVGLGGRLDAVNCLDSDLAIITSIGIDHTEWLGPTREDIAREKAGIARANRPLICGDKHPPENLAKIAQELKVPFFCQNKDFSYEKHTDTNNWTWSSSLKTYKNLPTPKILHQNASTALMALTLLENELKAYGTTSTQIKQAINHSLQVTQLPGRLQEVNYANRKLILDVSHNPQASKALKKFLEEKYPLAKKVAILGCMRDKDLSQMLQILKPIFEKWFLSELETPRSFSLTQLEDIAQAEQLSYFKLFQNILSAWQDALANTREKDIIVIFGSFFAISPILKIIQAGFPL